MIGNESKIEVLETQLDSLKSQVFVLFGLLVLTLGGLTYCLYTLLSETTPDLIQATRIQVVDDDGFPLIDLHRNEFDRHSAGVISVITTKGSNDIMDGEGTRVIALGTDDLLEVGLAQSASSLTGKDLWSLSCSQDGKSGFLELYNQFGDALVCAGSDYDGGFVNIRNNFTEPVVLLQNSPQGNGQIYLQERKDLAERKFSKPHKNVFPTQIRPDKPASNQ